MVHRRKDLQNPPIALIDTKWDKLKSDLLKDKHNHEASSTCYRDTTINELVSLYERKCAMCERSRGNELQVDHYRPKKARHFIIEQNYNQPGYYWLTYEWSNLLPICSKCNSIKSNKFPLKGWKETNRISSHVVNGVQGQNTRDINWLNNHEKPLLINPETDKKPGKHFKFYKNGEVEGRTSEGKETINICGLNRRDLIIERRIIIEGFVKRVESALDEYNSKRNIESLAGELKGVFKSIKSGCDYRSDFSLLHEFIYQYYGEFIDSQLPNNLRGTSLKYFQEFMTRK